jgi:hypothetical protein
MPPVLLVIVPLPFPARETWSVCDCGCVAVNVTVGVRLPLIVTVQMAPLVESQPAHVAVFPFDGDAVSVMMLVVANVVLHADPQLIPDG